MNYPTEQHRLWLILPLVYKKAFEKVCADLEPCGWREDALTTRNLFFHIRSLIGKEPRNERIGRIFSLQERLKYGLQNNATSEYILKGGDFSASFYLDKIQLVLFETQTAFLVFQIKLRENATLEELTLGGYYLKKIRGEEIEVSFAKKISKDQTERVKTALNELAKQLLSPLDVETYFETEQEPPRQAFIYSAAILSAESFKAMRDNNELRRALFELRRSFKKSYKPAPKEFDLENNPDVLRLFDNIYWGISLEGVASLAFYVGEKETDEFVKSFMGKLSTSYFYILLLALHQRYALLKYNIDAAKIEKAKHGDLRKISDLQEQIAWFQLRAMFAHISSNTHYTLLYERLCAVFRIKELAAELLDEIRTLAILSRLKQDASQKEKEREEQKRREEKREREKKLEKIFITLSTLLVGVSLASDGLQSGMTAVLDAIFGNGFAEIYKTRVSWLIFGLTGLLFWWLVRKGDRADARSNKDAPNNAQ